MSFEVKEELKKKFNPYLTTAINGNVVRVSIKDLEKHPEKYVNTHLVELYKNPESIKSRLKKTRRTRTQKLDMEASNVKRGFSFEEGYKSPRQKSIEQFMKASSLKLKKFAAKVEADAKAVVVDEVVIEKPKGKAKTTKKTATKETTAEQDAINKGLEEEKKNK